MYFTFFFNKIQELNTMIFRLFLGGSFDPVHEGHTDMVRAVSERLTAVGCPFVVYFLPTAGNPFKGKPTDPVHRLAMLDLACQSLMTQGVQADICPLEIHQTPPIYTIDTVQELHKLYPNDELIFIMGGDSLASLHLWKDFGRIFDFVKIWAFARVGTEGEICEQILAKMTEDFGEFLTGDKAIFYDQTPIPAISSSQIRTDLQHGKTPVHLSTPILNYIKAHELYKNVL